MVQHVPEKAVPEPKIAVWTPWGSQKTWKGGKRDRRSPSPSRPNELNTSALDRAGKPRITAA